MAKTKARGRSGGRRGQAVTARDALQAGQRALRSRRPDQARGYADRILAVEPTHAGAMKLRVAALSQEEDYDRALEWQQCVVTQEPENSTELQRLMRLAAMCQGQGRLALCAAERLRAQDPGDYSANKLLGALYGTIGYRERADELALTAAASREPFETRKAKGRERLRVIKFFSIANGTLRYNGRSGSTMLQGTNNIATFLDDQHVTIHDVPIESLDQKPDLLEALPEADVIYNAIADGDRSGDALSRALPYIDTLGLPVVNHPADVLKTTRMGTATRLRGLEGVIAPRTVNLPGQSGDCSAAIRKKVAENELRFPILVRPRQAHGEQHLVCFTEPEEIAYRLEGSQRADLNITEYVDCSFQSPKAPHLKLYAKYRLFLIDGQLYPAHCEISDHYKVTLGNSMPIMRQYPAFIDQAKRFLADPESVLGGEVLERVRAVLEATELDYAAVDFCPLETGEIVVFEANAAMRNRLKGRRLPWEGEAYQAMVHAFHQMLVERAGVSGWDYQMPQIAAELDETEVVSR